MVNLSKFTLEQGKKGASCRQRKHGEINEEDSE
jgi:hypothetical protein